MIKAVALFPGKPSSTHLTQLAEPSLDDVPDGQVVLVRIRLGHHGPIFDSIVDLSDHGSLLGRFLVLPLPKMFI